MPSHEAASSGKSKSEWSEQSPSFPLSAGCRADKTNSRDNPIATSQGRRMPVIPRTRSLSRNPLFPQGPRCIPGFFRNRRSRPERCRRNSPVISIEQFRRMRHFFSARRRQAPAYSGHFSGHVRIVVQINVQNQSTCPAAARPERKSPPARQLQAPRSASSPRSDSGAHPNTPSTDPRRPPPQSRFSPEETSARSRRFFRPSPRCPPLLAMRATAVMARTSNSSRACCPSTDCTSRTRERDCESPRCSQSGAYPARWR